ncbi:mitotic-spindle organizing protein 2A [Trichonephila clavipes]|nr:mitotic-spindle organizing protein 2A [Trichonephila clavipes]
MACERKLLESEATTGFFVLLGTKGKKETLEWCMKANLIASRYDCPRCKKEMRLQERKGTVDGYERRCRSQSKDNPHDVVRSVRKGTWFSESKLAITIILRLTRYWFGKSMNAFVVNDDLTVTSWWMTIFMNSLHPSQRCIHQRNMTKCKRKPLTSPVTFGLGQSLHVDVMGKFGERHSTIQVSSSLPNHGLKLQDPSPIVLVLLLRASVIINSQQILD